LRVATWPHRYRLRRRALSDRQAAEPSIALGYVAIRIFECAVIAVGIISLFAVLSLQQDLHGAGAADAASLGLVGQGLVAIHDATFLIGPGVLAGSGTGCCWAT